MRSTAGMFAIIIIASEASFLVRSIIDTIRSVRYLWFNGSDFRYNCERSELSGEFNGTDFQYIYR